MELRMPTPEQVRTVYAADLKESFPPTELKPLRAIEELWAEGWYRPWCLFDGDEIVGECFLWLGHPGWALLDYLCVSPRCRNGGTGALLIEKMLEREQGMVILGESEAPEDAPDPVMAKRRLGFYDRNSAKVAGYDTEMFGAHYKTLYWADAPLADEVLMAEHRFIYQNRFSPEKYAKYVRIPWDPTAEPGVQVPWDE
ncbi:GNAT family N-acetyltransferase [Oscillibacter sp.]|uniref:GNAT family N-acetyltransferase n=1 Tax=Oscillibacter sp. TaxID=1945593 RepID=UPI0026066FAD|nr:GNAT family N-acetyltransferase [Oscillibacter sp.]MDD3347183.1 GNAT family N-acetyltransferase [Oscillibacter sp.]